MSKIVVSGANGFLASNLVKKLSTCGHEIWVILRPESKENKELAELCNVKFIRCAYEDRDFLCANIGAADAWFHFAWGGVNRDEIDSPEVQKRNVEMSVEVLKSAHRLGCRVFMDAGSRVEYGVTEDGHMVEDMVCHPVNEYGKAKLEFYNIAKDMCEEYGIKYCHLRFFSVYGYGDHPWSIISTLVRDLPKGEKVSLSACRHKWNFMYIDDAVDAVYSLYESVDSKNSFNSGIFNIASADTRELKSFVQEIHNIVGNKGELEFGSFVQAKEGALSIIPSIKALESITSGWKERYSFEQGIRETIKRENENNYEEN